MGLTASCKVMKGLRVSGLGADPGARKMCQMIALKKPSDITRLRFASEG